jgi:hypothetical protein
VRADVRRDKKLIFTFSEQYSVWLLRIYRFVLKTYTNAVSLRMHKILCTDFVELCFTKEDDDLLK